MAKNENRSGRSPGKAVPVAFVNVSSRRKRVYLDPVIEAVQETSDTGAAMVLPLTISEVLTRCYESDPSIWSIKWNLVHYPRGYSQIHVQGPSILEYALCCSFGRGGQLSDIT